MTFFAGCGGRIVAVGTSYKAKTMCSEVFVAGREPDTIFQELLIDDLNPLKYIKTDIDHDEKTVTASFYGCSLTDDAEEPVTGELITQSPAAHFELEFEIDLNLNTSDIERIVDESFLEPILERKRRTRAVVILHNGKLIVEKYSADIDSDFSEELSDPLADVVRMILQEKDMAEFAGDKEMISMPGTTWHYSSGNTILLSKFMHNVLGTTNYRNFPTKELFSRIGMEHPFLESDSAGTFVGSSFMYATARDWARFGQLYLQDGMWGSERLLPEGWVEYSITPTSASEEYGYGSHFWLEIPKEYKSPKNVTLPEGSFHAIGHEGQFITIVPSHDLVIVRLGRTRYPNAWEHDLFVDRIIAAIE